MKVLLIHINATTIICFAWWKAFNLWLVSISHLLLFQKNAVFLHRRCPFSCIKLSLNISVWRAYDLSICVHLNVQNFTNQIRLDFSWMFFPECWVAWPVGTCPQDEGGLHRPFESEIIWRHWMKPMVRQKYLRDGGALLQPAIIKVVPLFKRDWN